MKKIFQSLLSFIVIFTTSAQIINNTTKVNSSYLVIGNITKGIISSALDFIPVIGNIKCLGEATIGKDFISGEDLSIAERILSFAGAIPLGNYLKNGKHLKNGQKFLKAAKRAKHIGNLKNYISFAKAGSRAMAKANKIQKSVKLSCKFGKSFLKFYSYNSDKK